jgi:hypothetical protein
MKKVITTTVYKCDFCKEEIKYLNGGTLLRKFTFDDRHTISDPLVYDPDKDRHFHSACVSRVMSDDSIVEFFRCG